MLRKVKVLFYYLVFFVLLVGGALVIHWRVKENNLALLWFVGFLLIDGLFCYYVSIAAATQRVKVTIDDGVFSVDRGSEGAIKVGLADIIEYEIIGRRIAPKDILELILADRTKLKFVCKLPWSGESDDFEALVNYFKRRPQVAGTDRIAELPTAE